MGILSSLLNVAQFILSSLEELSNSEKVVLVNQYDEILWKFMFCEALNDSSEASLDW